MEANAALRNIVRDTGEGYRGMLERLAQESVSRHPRLPGASGPQAQGQEALELGFQERPRGQDRQDGTAPRAYKPEHAVDLDTGAVELHPADEGDTTTLPKTLAAAEANLEAVDVAPTAEDPAECVTIRATTHGWS